MRGCRALFPVLVLLAAAPAAGAWAQSGSDQPGSGQAPSPAERLQEGAAAIVEGLRLFMDQLQSYQPPEILPNGDIIIRRRPPADPGPDAPPKRDAPAAEDAKPRSL